MAGTLTGRVAIVTGVPGSFCSGADLRDFLPLAQRLAAEGRTELVLLIGLPTKKIKCIFAVELVVAEKLVHVAVERIGSGLDYSVHDGAVAAPEF